MMTDLIKERNPLFFFTAFKKKKTKPKNKKDKLLFSPAGDFHNSTFISKNLCMANASILKNVTICGKKINK